MLIGLIKEGKTPADYRVALTPQQCKWLQEQYPSLKIIVEPSEKRCFSDKEYLNQGIEVSEDLSKCDILFGIKEVPIDQLIPNKTYLFFSHTIKKQSYNRKLLQAIVEKNIRLIDYECLVHEDGQRIIGFGFFAGIVGAHNGIMAYGNRTKQFELPRVFTVKDYRTLIRQYFGLKLPPIKVVVTGSGRVAHGIIEIMNLMGLTEVEPDDYLERKFKYPVFTQLKGADLYTHKETKTYKRNHFHEHPTEYRSRFLPYTHCSDILLNGIYWDEDIPRLFEKSDVNDAFTIQTISDITDDAGGSVPINLGDQTIEDPVYGVDRILLQKTAPYLPGSIDIVAVGNLPSELPRDASEYFGQQLIKYVMEDLLQTEKSTTIQNATIVENGKLTKSFNYLTDYLNGL